MALTFVFNRLKTVSGLAGEEGGGSGSDTPGSGEGGGSGGKAGGGSGEAGGRAEVDGRSHVRAAGAEGPSPLVDRDQQHLQKCQKSVHCQDLEAPQMGADDDRVEYVPSPAFPAGRRRRPVSAIRGELKRFSAQAKSERRQAEREALTAPDRSGGGGGNVGAIATARLCPPRRNDTEWEAKNARIRANREHREARVRERMASARDARRAAALERQRRRRSGELVAQTRREQQRQKEAVYAERQQSIAQRKTKEEEAIMLQRKKHRAIVRAAKPRVDKAELRRMARTASRKDSSEVEIFVPGQSHAEIDLQVNGDSPKTAPEQERKLPAAPKGVAFEISLDDDEGADELQGAASVRRSSSRPKGVVFEIPLVDDPAEGDLPLEGEEVSTGSSGDDDDISAAEEERNDLGLMHVLDQVHSLLVGETPSTLQPDAHTPPTPQDSGAKGARVESLREQCEAALGDETFMAVYSAVREAADSAEEAHGLQGRLETLLTKEQMGHALLVHRLVRAEDALYQN